MDVTPDHVSHYWRGARRPFLNLSDLEGPMLDGVIAITALPEESTSFTYPDSFTAMGLAPDYGLPYEARPYHHQVFRLDQLEAVVGEYGPPAEPDGYEGCEHQPFEAYVEVQLWSDAPVAHLLDGGGH